MTACREYEPLLLERLSGGLDDVAGAELAVHLEACAACRAEASALEEALALAALPPPTPEEERALANLPAQTMAAIRRRERRGYVFRGIAAGLVAAAAVVVAVVLGPGTFRHPSRSEGAGTAVAQQRWQVPDVDTLWTVTGAASGDSSYASGDVEAGYESIALAALDAEGQ